MTDQSLTRNAKASLWLVALTYVLLLPMMFYSAGGEFSFEESTGKTDSGMSGNSITHMQTNSGSSQRIGEILLFMPILTFAIASRARAVSSMCLQMKSFTILISWTLLSTVWSQDPTTSFRNGIYLIINTLFGFYLLKRFSPSQQMQFFSIVGVAFLTLNVLVSTLLPQYGITSELDGTRMWQGICAHKNLCAYTTVFLICQIPFMRATSRWGRRLRIIYLCLSLVVIILTESRTGWILTAALFGFTALLRLRRRLSKKDMMLVTVAAMIVGVITATVVATYLPVFLTSIGKDTTLNGRTPIWSAVFVSIMKEPITGYGFHAFWMGLKGESANVAAIVLWDPNFAHNGILQVWLEIGVVGVILILSTFVASCKNAYEVLSDSDSHIDWYLCIVFLTLIVNIDEDTFIGTAQIGWTLYVVACGGLYQAKQRKTSQHYLQADDTFKNDHTLQFAGR